MMLRWRTRSGHRTSTGGEDLAGRKEFELLFKLQASLGSNFIGSFSRAVDVTKQLQDKISQTNRLSGKIEGFQRQSAALQANKDKLQHLIQEHDRLQKEIDQTERPTEALRQKMERTARQIQQTTIKIEQQEAQLKKLGDELSDAGVDTNRLTKENERLSMSYDRMKRSQERLSAIAQEQQRNAEAASKTRMQLAGTIGTVAALGAMIYAGPVKKSVAFNKEMANVATLLDGEIQPRIQQLSQDVLKLSNKSGITTGNLTDGLYQVVSAFGDSAESAKQLEIAAKAAKAGNATTTDAINLLSAVTKGYGDTSAKAQQKAADLAFMTAKLGQTTFPELAASMGKVVPLASTLTVKEEELFGVMATLTGVTGNTAEVSTQLRGTLQGFLQPTSQMSKAMAKLGFANGKAMLESLGLQGSLEALKQSVNGDEIAFSGLFGSIEAKNAVLALTGEQAENLTAKTLQMYKAAGAAQAAFDIMNNAPEAKIERAKNSIQNLGTVLGATFLPHIASAADSLSELVTRFSEWGQENPELLSMIVKLSAGFFGLKTAALAGKLAFHDVSGGILMLRKTWTKLQAIQAMGGIQSLFGSPGRIKGYFQGIAHAAGGVSGAFKTMFSGTKLSSRLMRAAGSVKGLFLNTFTGISAPATRIFTGMAGSITGIFSKTAGMIMAGPFGRIGTRIASRFGRMTGFLTPLLGPLKHLGTAILGPFGGILGKVLPVVGVITLIISAIQILRNNLDKVREIVGRVFGEGGLAVFDKVVSAVTNIGNAIKNIFTDGNLGGAREFLINLFGENAIPAIDAAISVLHTVWNVLSGFIAFVDSNIRPIVEQLFQFIVGTVLPQIGQAFAEWAPMIADVLQTAWNVIQTVATAIVGVIQFVMPTVQSIIGVGLQTITGVISGALSAIKGLVDVFAGVFTGDWTRVWEGVKNIFSGVWESIKSIASGILNGIISMMNGVIGGLNKLKIPEWVPGIGGKGVNIPTIPMFARGSQNTPDTFIAGEQGAELITNAKGRTVFTAAQTGQILQNIHAARSAQSATTVVSLLPLLQAALSTAGVHAVGVSAPSVTAAQQQTAGVVIHSAPVFHVGSDAQAQDIEDILNRRDEELLNEFDSRMKQKGDDERRQRYD